jgi:predicted O-methyltransferase YrrM
MDEYNYYTALRDGRPYFGPKYASLQGVPQRHAYMRALVHALTEQKQDGPIRILEIGSWAGGSSITWAATLEECGREGKVFCVDPWKISFNDDLDRGWIYREMRSAVEDDAIHQLFMHNVRAAGVEARIVTVRGHSEDVLPGLARGYFDAVFIDGSHRYADVLADIRNALPLVRSGGVLCGDDLELEWDACTPEALREGLESGADYILDPQSNRFYHPGVTAAVHEALSDVSSWDGFWAVQVGDQDGLPLRFREEHLAVPAHLTPSDPEPHPVYMEDGTAQYRFAATAGRYYAVSRALGEIELLGEPVGAREMPPLVLMDDDLHRLRARVAEVEKSNVEGSQIIEATSEYLLLQMGCRTFAALLPATILSDVDPDRLRRRAAALTGSGPLLR